MNWSNVVELTPPSAEPIAVADAQTHLRVFDDDPAELAYLSGLIASAREVCEGAVSRPFIARPFRAYAPGFRDGRTGAGFRAFALPRPPLVSVASVKYLDPAGALQTVPTSVYTVLPGGPYPGTVAVLPGQCWPATSDRPDAVQVDFVAGFGPTAAAVPVAIRQAMLLLVGLWYDSRQAATPMAWKDLPFGVAALLRRHRWGAYG